jgi:PAS domain S-box-containing protein
VQVKRHTVRNKARHEDKKRRPRGDRKITASARSAARELIRADMKNRKPASRALRNFSADGAVRKNAARKRAASAPVFKHPKTELEAAVQRYVDLFEFAPIAYVSFNRAGRIEEVNLAAAQLLGGACARLIGQPFALHVTKKDGSLFLNHLLRCRSSDSRVETEMHLKKRNGEIILAHLASSPMTSSMRDGALLYQTAIVDLTERKRFEEKIQRSEERYRTLFDLVPVAVYVCDADGIIQEYNRRAAELWGREPGGNGEGPRFCGSYKIYYPDGRLMPHEECPVARALRGEKLKAEDLEIIVERPDGERRHVIPAPRILTNIHGEITGAIISLFDITERKRAEAAAMRLAAVVQSSHDAVAAKTLNGIITDWNQSAERIFGYKPKEIIGKSVLTLIPKDRQDEEQEILRRIRHGESLDHYETVRRRKDGQLIDVSLTISPIKNPKGEIVGVSKIARDITNQKQTERRLVEQARLLNLTNDSIIVRDHQDRIVYWNRGAEEMYGFSAKEALGKITHELLQTAHPENLEKIRKNLERDNRWSGELVHTRKDGKTITVFSRWRLDQDVRGRPASILETNTDVAARKRAEQQQRALYQFSQLQYIATNVDEMHDAALDTILAAMDCRRAAILLFDKEKVMRFVAWRGLSERYRKAVKGHSPWKPDAKSPKPVCITDVDIADIPKPLKSTIRSEGIRAAAFIPLVSSRKLIGKFMTYYDTRHVFTDEELKLATTIATQLAQAIEHKRDEEALRQSEERLRAIVQEANAGMARYDPKGRIEFANSRFCQMLGYKEAELIGKTVREITYPDDLEKTKHALDRALRKGEPTEIDKRYVCKDESLIWVNVSDAPEYDIAGRIKFVVAVAVDITARRKAEEALREKETELELMVTQTPFMLTRCTRDLRYRYVSRAYADLVGRRPEEIAGKPIVEIVGKEGLEKILPYIKKVLKGHTTEYEMEVPFQGVGVYWLHTVYTPDRDSEGNVVGWFASLADVSRRKEAEALLQRSNELLEKRVGERTRELHLANKELKAEIARRKGLEGEILEISDREQQRLAQELHDGLCQHLTAVAFMARSVGLRLKNHRVIEVKDIEKIAELVNNAATDTRNLSRALHRVDVDAPGLVGALEDLVDREMWRTPCRLEVKPSFHLEDDTAAAHLYRIAREAVINANKHAQAREIVVALRGWRKGIVLSVIDDGVGFQNARNGARGLGFHIMNYRARLMGGELKIESPEKGGTRVACYLPDGTLESHKRKRRAPERLSAKLTKALTALI